MGGGNVLAQPDAHAQVCEGCACEVSAFLPEIADGSSKLTCPRPRGHSLLLGSRTCSPRVCTPHTQAFQFYLGGRPWGFLFSSGFLLKFIVYWTVKNVLVLFVWPEGFLFFIPPGSSRLPAFNFCLKQRVINTLALKYIFLGKMLILLCCRNLFVPS